MTTTSGVALLRYAGFMTWGLAGLPLIVRLSGHPALLGEPRYWLWLTWFFIFGIAFAMTAWRTTPVGPRWRQLVSLAIQTMSALAMIQLVCSGQEGALLVIVAAQLGWVLPLGRALAWVAAQALIMCAILALSWPNDVTLRLMSMYLGFQVLALFSCFVTAREATARASLDQANRELQATRELLASTARLAERERISRELHDTLGHHLTALSLNLEAAKHLPAEEALKQVSRAQDITKSLLGDVREVVSTLREGSPIQLRESLRALVETVPLPRIHLKLPDHLVISDPVIAHTLLRCVQETVTNAIRHAHASNLWIELIEDDGHIEVRAVDDGQGAQSIRLGRGLAGMRERVEAIGGRLAIQSQVGKGFDLSVSIPLSTGVS
jgi:signal transduction histidine kinase